MQSDENVSEIFGMSNAAFAALPTWKQSQLKKSASGPSTRARSATDAMSGLSLNRADFPTYSEEELQSHFTTFTAYDLDSTGYISPQNLLDVLMAMEVPDASLEMVTLIIDEVSVLTGHENDGTISFRDYMQCIAFDHQAAMHNLAIEAEEELLESVEEEKAESRRLSQCEEEDETAAAADADAPTPTDVSDALAVEVEGKLRPSLSVEEAPASPGPTTRMRQSSMAAVAALAAVRIKAFQQQADETSARDKLEAFKRRGTRLSGPIVNSEEIHKMTLAKKVQAFETAARFKGKIELKKTWRQVGTTRNYNPGTRIEMHGAPTKPPPKKRLSDLP